MKHPPQAIRVEPINDREHERLGGVPLLCWQKPCAQKRAYYVAWLDQGRPTSEMVATDVCEAHMIEFLTTRLKA